MTLKEEISQIVGYRIKDGNEGWDEAAETLGKTGIWSIQGSPKKFQAMILALFKHVEALEHDKTPVQSAQ